MKRFHEAVAVRTLDGGGHEIALDGRPVRTPLRAAQRLPTLALAEAVAKEWRAQGDEIDPASMPMLTLANTAIDRVGLDRDRAIDTIAVYGETDMISYLADEPPALVQAQAARWIPIREWLLDSHGIELLATAGIMPLTQAPETLHRLRLLVEALDDMEVTALHEFTTLSGSIAIALALASGRIDAEVAWTAAEVDETHQAELWGRDEEAEARRRRRGTAFRDAARFLELARGGRARDPSV